MSNVQLARMLGWTSLAIGATELAATKWLQEQMGVGDHDTLLRVFGVREIGAGLMILDQPGINRNLAAALWARVAGDALDLAALGLAGTVTRNPRGLSAITAIVLAVTGLDVFVAARVQADLGRAARASAEARRRVRPANALPNGVTPVEASAPVSSATA